MKISNFIRSLAVLGVMALTSIGMSGTSYAATIYSTTISNTTPIASSTYYATACNKSFNEPNTHISAFVRIKNNSTTLWSGTLAYNSCATVIVNPSFKGTVYTAGVYSGTTLIGGLSSVTIYKL